MPADVIRPAHVMRIHYHVILRTVVFQTCMFCRLVGSDVIR